MLIKYDSMVSVKRYSTIPMVSLGSAMVEERKKRPQGETVYIDEDERLAITRKMADATPPISGADLARLCKVTPSAITLLLSKPIPKGKTRGCRFMPALQRALGLAVTAKKRPAVLDRDAARRAEKLLQELSGEKLEHWLENGELLAGKR